MTDRQKVCLITYQGLFSPRKDPWPDGYVKYIQWSFPKRSIWCVRLDVTVALQMCKSLLPPLLFKTEHPAFYIRTVWLINTWALPGPLCVSTCFACTACVHLTADMFSFRANRVTDRQHETTFFSPLHLEEQWAIKKETLFHEFFRQAVLLGLKSLSSAVCSCIFNREKHTRQDATDF